MTIGEDCQHPEANSQEQAQSSIRASDVEETAHVKQVILGDSSKVL
jgi:hypothetical protein